MASYSLNYQAAPDRRFIRNTLIALALGTSTAGYSVNAYADGLDFISGTLTNDLHDISRFGSNYLGNRNNVNAAIEANITAQLSDKILFRAIGAYDQVKDPSPSSDIYIRGHGLRAKDIYFQYDDGTYGGQLGRITANFGTAWYLAPGLKATLLAEDYAIWDRFGASGWVQNHLGAFGDIKVGGSVFFLDTTSLSGTALGERHRKTEWSGGPSNTGSPNSFSVSGDGSNIPSLPGFTWHAAALYQSVDFRTDSNGNRLPDSRDELGFVVGISQAVDITKSLQSTTLLEAVRFENKAGSPNVGRTYLTIGDALKFGSWRIEGTGTLRSTNQPGTGTISDHLITTSVGYDFTKVLALDLGFQHSQFGSLYEDMFRLRLRYVLGF